MIGNVCYHIFKAVGLIEAELHIFKIKKLDACIRQDPFSQIQSRNYAIW